MKQRSNLFTALLSIIIGILFCIYKGGIIGIATTIIGVMLLIIGVLGLVSGVLVGGLIYIILGIVIIVFGWVLTTVVLYIIAVILILIGVLEIIGFQKQNIKGTNMLNTILLYLAPILYIVIGVLLFFNQGGTINWIFYVTGILLIIDGIIGVFGYALNNKSN